MAAGWTSPLSHRKSSLKMSRPRRNSEDTQPSVISSVFNVVTRELTQFVLNATGTSQVRLEFELCAEILKLLIGIKSIMFTNPQYSKDWPKAQIQLLNIPKASETFKEICGR